MASSKIRGITIELSADASGVLKSVEEVNKKIKSTSSQMKDVDKLLKMDPSNMSLLTQKTELLQKQIGNTKTKLEELKKAQADMDANGVDKNSEQYQALQREIIATEQELKQLERTAGSGSAALAKISAVTGQIGDKMENAGKKLSVVSAGIVALGAAALKSFNEVDEGADIVIKETGATGEAAEELEQSYKNVAKNIVADWTDIGNAVGYVSTRFGATGEDLEDLSETFLKFANINDMDVTSAVEGVDKALKTFNVSSDQAENVMGLLSKTSQDTGISMDTLLSLLQSSGATLKEMGLDIDDAVTLMGNFEAAGLESSEMLSKLQKAAAYYNEKGLDMSEGLSDLIRRLQDSATEADATAEAYSIFGKKGGLAFITAAKEGKISLDDLGTSLEDYASVVDETYEATLDGTDKMALAWQNMQLGLADLGEAIGNTLAPIMDKVTTAIQKVVDWFENLDDDTKELIVTIGLIVAAVGPLLVVGGKVMKGISSITGALSSMGSISFGPIGIAITAITALSAAGVALFNGWKNAYQDASPFTQALDEIAEKNDALTQSIANTKQSYEDTVTASEASADAAGVLWQKIQDLTAAYNGSAEQQAIINGLVSEMNELVPGLALSWDSVTNSLSLTTDEVYNYIEAMKAQAQVAALSDMYTQSLKDQYEAQKNVKESAQILKGVMDRYGVSIEEITKMIADGNISYVEAYQFLTQHGIKLTEIQGYTEELCGALNEYLQARQNQADVDENVAWVEGQLGEAMVNAAQQAKDSADTVVAAADQINEGVDFTPAEETAQAAGENIPAEMAAGIESGTGDVAAATEVMADTVTDGLSGLPADTNKAGEDAGSNLDSGFDSYSDIVADTVDDMYEIFYKTLGVDLPPLMYKWGNKAGERYNTGISETESKITASVNSIQNSIKTVFTSLPNSMYVIGSQTGQGLYNGLASWQSALSNVAWSIADSINSAARRALQIKSPSKVMQQIGEYTGAGLEIGLEDSAGGILATASRISNSMAAALTPQLSGINAINAGISAGNARTQAAASSNMTGINTILQLLTQYLPDMAADKQILFDDGTWAGQLAPAMNRKFAQMAALSARG